MSAYPTGVNLAELVLAMRDAARQDADAFHAVGAMRVTGDTLIIPDRDVELHFVPLRTATELVDTAEQGNLSRYRHEVEIRVVKHTWGADEDSFERILTDTTSANGLVSLLAEVEDYFENNMLGLTFLDRVPNLPTCAQPPGAFDSFVITENTMNDDDESMLMYVSVAKTTYTAYSRLWDRVYD